MKISTYLKYFIFSALFCLIASITSEQAYAINKRRVCANGNVQYTPCKEGIERKAHTPQLLRNIKPTSKGKASLSKTTFQKIKHNQGLWKGFLKANGEVHLRLNIIRNGIREDSRYMGSVQVSNNEKPTKFFFKSPIPKGKNWSWEIDSDVYG